MWLRDRLPGSDGGLVSWMGRADLSDSSERLRWRVSGGGPREEGKGFKGILSGMKGAIWVNGEQHQLFSFVSL